MSSRQPFQLPSTPVQPGITLIEASAGTGKTFTIAGLFLRLILERDLSVRQILVVTFTEAATEELRDRIRRTLRDAAAALRDPASASDSLRAVLAPHLDRTPEMLLRLDRALSGFDEAPIFTIHSFCQRVLKDRAFESGALFDTELLTDSEPLLLEAADDFWRLRFHDAEPVTAALLLQRQLAPESLLKDIQRALRHPGLRLISACDDLTLTDVIASVRESFETVIELWQAERETIRDLAVTNIDWAKIDYRREASKMAWRLDESLGGLPTPEAFDAIAFFSSSEIQESRMKKAEPPTHPFFARCEEFHNALAPFHTVLRIDFVRFALERLPARKRARKVQTFDDLLNLLHSALRSPNGPALAREVRARYAAALIDEFQDTDPVQYQNFHGIFASAADPSLLFLIGDPKQAIYGFRGADIFTYLDAARRVDHHYTLGQNWRSEAGLVHAVNTVFAAAPQPFLFDEIQFTPVAAAGQADDEPLTENGTAIEPFHLWFMPRGDDGKSISKGRAEEILPGLVAGEIARLLNNDVRLGPRKLAPRDIAVLVRKNHEAALMQEALRALDIPSVLQTEASVFQSEEAPELARVLASLAHPGDERRLRAALTTSLLGVDGPALAALAADDDRWHARLQQDHLAHQRWQQDGFTLMFRHWLQTQHVRPRLLRHPDGERRLTNLLHLAEILHDAAEKLQLAPPALVRWLEQQLNDEERAREEAQLRLESDDQAVRLVTVHKSKGLEYPVVFCPFSWASAESKFSKDEALFHRPATDGDGATELVLDLGSKDFSDHLQLAMRERLAESLRLLYVALTRACNRCYFVWGGFNGAGTSAAAWLLHRPPEMTEPSKEILDAHFAGLDDPTMLADLGRLIVGSQQSHGNPTIRLVTVDPAAAGAPYQPPASANTPLAPRTFNGRIRRDWRVTSFSQLTAETHNEAPDYDPAPGPVATPTTDDTEPEGIFAFPRGAGPGTCLHKIFETIDFTNLDPDTLARAVESALQSHGLPVDFTPVVCANVRDVLTVPLPAQAGSFSLSEIPTSARLNELEFLFPVAHLTPARLREGFGHLASSDDFLHRLQRLDFERVGGFVKGFIDLVFERDGRFYIVDWKSNWLGNRVEDYDTPAIAAEMAENLYPLQYHLYCVALHQHLAHRITDYDYDRHFGGVFYIFLRGVDPARPEFGLHCDRPPRERIETLGRLLGASPTSAPGHA